MRFHRTLKSSGKALPQPRHEEEACEKEEEAHTTKSTVTHCDHGLAANATTPPCNPSTTTAAILEENGHKVGKVTVTHSELVSSVLPPHINHALQWHKATRGSCWRM